MKKPLKILILEDNPSDAELIKLELRKTNKEFESRLVQDEKNFLKELKTFQPDLILSDYSMPQFTGLDALDIAKEKCPEIPFIIVTGTLNEETAIKCIRWGAWDYVLKDRLIHLGHAVKNAIKIKTENEKKKLAEEALRESEEKFREMANLLPQIVYETDIQGNLTFVNKQAFASFGYSQKDYDKGINVLQTLIPEDIERAKKNIQNIINGKAVGSPEYTALKKDGTTFPVLIYSSSILKDNKPDGIRGIIIDITERKKAEEALQESEERFQKLLENVPTVAVQGYNPDGIINYWNKANEFIYGYTAEEAIGKNLVDLIIPPEMREDVQKIIKHGAKTGEMLPAGELTLMRKDGKPVTVFSSHAVVQQTGKEPELFCIDVDLTERKKAEESLRKSEQQYHGIFNSTTDSFLIFDMKGNIVEANPQACKIYGYTYKEIIKLSGKDIVHPDYYHIFGKFKQDVLTTGEFHAESVDIHKNGTFFDVEVRGTGFDYKGKPHLMAIVRDITERKKAENIQRTLYDISNALNTVDNLHEFFIKIREYLGNVIDTTNFYIALYDEKTDMLSLPFDVDEKDKFETFPAGKTLTAYVIKIGKPLLVDNKLLDRLIKEGKIETIGTPSKTWLGVPLKIGNQIIGVIAVQSYDDPNLYTERDMEILSFVSDEIALAIKHKKADEQIKRDLEEKEILLQEIHHRVKNNMQIISSLLKLQSAHIKDKRALELFQNSRDRVKTMALIHDALYRSKDLANIDFADYARKLTTQIFISYGANSNLIELKIDIQNVFLDISAAIPCGLIINELVSNSLKYAFPKGRKGEISISFAYKGKVNTLCVKDNGIGISGEIDLENSPTLGLLLVNSLAKQLDGTLKLEKVKGTSFKISFKKAELKTYGKVQS